MRGDTTTENELEEDDHGAAAASADGASGERRPSIAALQNMFKKVSQSPFHNQYQNLISSASDSSGLSVNVSQNKQDAELLGDPSAAASGVTDHQQPHMGQDGRQEALHLNHQDGVNRDLARMNPFYRNYLEFGSKGHTMEKLEEVNLDAIFVPRPDFQSTPLDPQLEMKTVDSEAKLSELPKNPFETPTPNFMQDLFQTPALPPNMSTNNYFHDVTLNTPDLLKPIPAQTQNPSKALQLKSSDLLEDEGVDLFQAAKGEDLFHTGHTSIFVDSFKSPLNKNDELFQSPHPNPFYTASLKEADSSQAVPIGEIANIGENTQDPFLKEDLFGMLSFQDVFSTSSTNTVDPFPSPIARDLFQDVSSLDDPFGATPSRPFDIYQDVSPETPDIFKPHPEKTNGKDVFGMTSSNTAPQATYSRPSTNLSDMKPDMLSPLHPFKASLQDRSSDSPPAIQAKPSDGQHNIFLTSPQGTEVDILQPSPFSRSRNRSILRSQSSAGITRVSTFKRPPMPLPRSKTPKTENPEPADPIKPEANGPKLSPKPAPKLALKPVVHPRPKTPETKLMEPDNAAHYVDVLLTGQERCVEDWPDDSPQLNPDFKPSGKLRLRRESMRLKAVSEGGSGDDQEEGSVKKKDRKSRLSLLPRRMSKLEKFSDDSEEKSRSLPNSRKSSKEYFSEKHMSAGEQDEMDYKKPMKTRGSNLRRASSSFGPTGKHMNGHLPQESKCLGDDVDKKSVGKKNSTINRWSQGKALDNSTGGEEEDEEVDSNGSKKKKKALKIRFVPQRGFAITVGKGAQGYTPRKNSKDKSQEDLSGEHGYTARKQSQDDEFRDVEKSNSLLSTTKAAFMDDELCKDTHHLSGFNGDEDPYEMEDCKPKKHAKKTLHGYMGRRSSQEDRLDDTNGKQKGSFLAEERYNGDWMEDRKPENYFAGKGTYLPSPGEMNDSEEDDVGTSKLKKKSKLRGFMKHKSKSKAMQPEWEDPPGATSSDFLSEAAKAEWLASQMDERTLAGLEDEDEGGDTDSLMEWWNTVEQWDEVPSDDEDQVLREDESKSFTILAGKVQRGLRVFNKIFTEQAEFLWQSVISLHAIADNINNFHNKAKIASITGGTTTAVGGVTAIAGLALAPITFGVSLVMTAVGVGVATAGGIASASAAISDNVNNMHDRKKVEVILDAYEAHLQAILKILHFVNQGLYKLRGHPFLRSGTQHYSADWEVRSAVQMIGMVDSPVMRATEVTDASLVAVQGLFQGIDKYFVKDSRELKKGCKKAVVGEIKELANVLNDGIVELNGLREELQEATGNV